MINRVRDPWLPVSGWVGRLGFGPGLGVRVRGRVGLRARVRGEGVGQG